MKPNKLILIIASIVFYSLLGILSASSLSDTWILVTAKAVKSEFVRDNSKQNSDGSAVLAPMTFHITFDDVSVKQGSISDYSKKLSFNIDARSDYPILNAEKIYLLLDITNKKPRLLKWGIVSSLICLPSDLIAPDYKDYYFELTKQKTKKGEKCSLFILTTRLL